MIETKLLRNAIVLAEHRNFARAAKSLNISQPTLSRNIQSLEKMLGAQLFDRRARTVLPTPVGIEFLDHARIIVNSTESLQEAVRQFQGLETGSLSIGAGPYVASGLIGEGMARFINDYPRVKTNVVLDDWKQLPTRLARGEFDFILSETSELGKDNDLEIMPFISHQGFFICGATHPLLEASNPDILDLLNYSFVLTALPARFESLFNNVFKKRLNGNSFSEQVTVTCCNDFGIIKNTVENSHAISIAHYGAISEELDKGSLRILPFHLSKLKTNYGVVKRRGITLSPASSLFIEILQEIDQAQYIKEAAVIDTPA